MWKVIDNITGEEFTFEHWQEAELEAERRIQVHTFNLTPATFDKFDKSYVIRRIEY